MTKLHTKLSRSRVDVELGSAEVDEEQTREQEVDDDSEPESEESDDSYDEMAAVKSQDDRMHERMQHQFQVYQQQRQYVTCV